MAIFGARPMARTTLTVALLLAWPAGLVALARCETCSESSHASTPAHELCGPTPAVTARCPMPCCILERSAPGVAATLTVTQTLPRPWQAASESSPAVAFPGIGTVRTGSNILSLPAPAQARGAPYYLLDSSFLL